MIVYGLWAGGAFSIGVGLLPVDLPRGARAPEGGAVDARAARVRRSHLRLRRRLRPLHGGEGRLPLHGVLDGGGGAQPHLPRAAAVRRHGARVSAAAPEPRRAGRQRRLRPLRHPDHPLPARPLPVRRRARARNRPDGEPRPRLRRRRREGPALGRARDLDRAAARCRGSARWRGGIGSGPGSPSSPPCW